MDFYTEKYTILLKGNYTHYTTSYPIAHMLSTDIAKQVVIRVTQACYLTDVVDISTEG